ncbi:hypothetical protein S245_017397 [Arachis hypogaea]
MFIAVAVFNFIYVLLSSASLPSNTLFDLFVGILKSDQEIMDSVKDDLKVVKERDPACISHVHCFLNFKGFLACQSHRVAHKLWLQGRKALAVMIQNRVFEIFAVGIHPGAKIGSRILLDHVTGLVVGETAVIGNNVSILHSMTLGGTGKASGDRNPKIGDGVLIDAGTCILGTLRDQNTFSVTSPLFTWTFRHSERRLTTTRLRHARRRWRELSCERRSPSTLRFAATKTTTAATLSHVGSSAADHRIDLSLASRSSATQPPHPLSPRDSKRCRPPQRPSSPSRFYLLNPFSFFPIIDLTRVSQDLAYLASDADLVILKRMKQCITSSEDTSKHSELQDYIEKQKVYLKMID